MRRIFTAVLPLLGIVGTAPPAAAAPGERWAAKSGEVTYRLVHKLHEVQGKSTKVEAAAVLDAEGLKVMARAPVASFDSGNGNRDAHMLEAVEAAKFPHVVVKAVVSGFAVPATGKTPLQLQGEVELHGVKVTVPIRVEIERTEPTRAVARLSFATKLTAHQIERPSLLFVPVDDELTVSGTLTMELQP